jgi:hypothetical protein
MPKPLSRQHDLSRPEIISRFHQRLEQGKRSKLTREERDTLALLLRDSLIEWALEGTDTRDRIEQRCSEEVRLLECGYSQSTLNSDYLPVYTRLIKEAVASGDLPLTEQNSYDKEWAKWDGSDSGVSRRHYALDFLTYDLATQKRLRAKSTQRNNERQDDLQPIEVEEYLDKLDWLIEIENDRPELLAIAIAGATGRRHTEVISLGVFEPEPTDHPYLLRFSGQQKKSGTAAAAAFEILTLLPAEKVLDAIERLRSNSEVRKLIGAHHDDRRIGKLNARINYWCDRELGAIVPTPRGFKSLTIHRLRGVYGAIAVYLFCHPRQHQHRFVQRYLGHVLDDEASRANSRATDHYFHFYPASNGQPLTERGVRLAEVPPLENNGDESASASDNSTMPHQSHPHQKRIEIYSDDYDRLRQAAPEAPSSADALHAILDRLPDPDRPTAEAEVEDRRDLVAIIARQAETISRQAGAIESSNARVERLAAQSQSSGNDEQLRALQQQVESLRAERDNFRARLHEARTKLDRIQSLFPGTGTTSESESSELKDLQNSQFSGGEEEEYNNAESEGEGENVNYQVNYQNKYPIEERCRRTLDGVFDWNLKHPESQQFAISPGFLRRIFNIYKDAAEEFCSAQADEIHAHHRQIGVSPERIRYFNRGKPYEALRQFVEQHYY